MTLVTDPVRGGQQQDARRVPEERGQVVTLDAMLRSFLRVRADARAVGKGPDAVGKRMARRQIMRLWWMVWRGRPR